MSDLLVSPVGLCYSVLDSHVCVANMSLFLSAYVCTSALAEIYSFVQFLSVALSLVVHTLSMLVGKLHAHHGC